MSNNSTYDRNKVIRKKYKVFDANEVKGLSFDMDDFNEKYPEGQFITGIMELKFSMIGPDDTVWAGKNYTGVFKFNENFPMSPPEVKFIEKMYHPNIYSSGNVCISILHAGNDPMGEELNAERWTPVHTLASIIMSIICIFHDPNLYSPANIDASVTYQHSREGLRKVINGEMTMRDAYNEAVSIRDGNKTRIRHDSDDEDEDEDAGY